MRVICKRIASANGTARGSVTIHSGAHLRDTNTQRCERAHRIKVLMSLVSCDLFIDVCHARRPVTTVRIGQLRQRYGGYIVTSVLFRPNYAKQTKSIRQELADGAITTVKLMETEKNVILWSDASSLSPSRAVRWTNCCPHSQPYASCNQ